MRVAVMGAGAVGGYFGGRLADAGADVHLIARGAHLRALEANGLHIRSERGDVAARLPVTDDPARVGPCDVVLFCVKAYDTAAAAQMLRPLVHRDTAVVSLQNGIANEAQVAAVVGSDHVMGGAAFVFASVAEPGVIVDAGGPGSIVFGEMDGAPSERGQRLLAMCERAEVPAEFVADIGVRIWEKFAFVCAQAGATAYARLPIGEIRIRPETWTMFRRLVDEVVALGHAEGVGLPNTTETRIAEFARTLEPSAFSSLYHDLVAGRRMELDALHGFVVRRSSDHGLTAPVSEAVYALLKPHADRAAP